MTATDGAKAIDATLMRPGGIVRRAVRDRSPLVMADDESAARPCGIHARTGVSGRYRLQEKQLGQDGDHCQGRQAICEKMPERVHDGAIAWEKNGR